MKWGSPTATMTVFKSGNIKIVGVKSREKALFMLETFMCSLRKIRGYNEAMLDITEGFKLGACWCSCCCVKLTVSVPQ